jgi:hypothetical protein
MMPVERIAQKIHLIRGQRVMLDTDLAVLYGVKPIRLREQVKRNIKRFPESYMFQLNETEAALMVSQNAIPSKKHLGGYLPYVFTEFGVVMLSNVLKSDKAIQMSFIVIDAFVRLRKLAELSKETISKINEHDIKLLLHDKKLKEHENSINAVVGHIIGTTKKKKQEKKYGFKIDENKNVVEEEQNVAIYC